MKIESIIVFVAWVLISGAMVLGGVAYYKFTVNECTTSPLTYGAKELKSKFGYDVIGIVYLETPLNVKLPMFAFNTTKMTRIQ